MALMWHINGAFALWLGYWIFLFVVVWRYEKRNRELVVENLKLRKLLNRRNGAGEAGGEKKNGRKIGA